LSLYSKGLTHNLLAGWTAGEFSIGCVSELGRLKVKVNELSLKRLGLTVNTDPFDICLGVVSRVVDFPNVT